MVEIGRHVCQCRAFELTLAHLYSNRHTSDGKAPDADTHRQFARVQAQFNY